MALGDILRGVNTRVTPQSEAAKPEQVKNSAGGYTFAISDVERLKRFLVLGTDAGTYYISPKDLTKKNASVVMRMAEKQPDVLLSTIVDVSLRGAAPKQNATLFALAVACSIGDAESRGKALSVLPSVARTGTHLFLFARYIEQFRGWGRQLRRGVASWYTLKDADKLAYQAVKYRQREGWSHRDLLRLSHPVTNNPELRATFDWITHNTVGENTPRLIEGFLMAQQDQPARDVADLVRNFGLTWEMLPDFALASTEVWDALLDNGMPQTALMRQLPRLTRLGMLPQLGGRTAEVAKQLYDEKLLLKARVHPINVLVAQKTYAQGRSERGSSTWTPTRQIIDALDAAFYKAFGVVEPAGKRTMLALDVSGSMGSAVTNLPLTAREASAAMAMVTMATEPDYLTVGFTSSGGSCYNTNTILQELSISPRQRLDDAIKSISNLPFGGTDCALPMMWALKRSVPVDTFVVYTDSETWGGSIHPHQALKQYREQMGIDAKLVVLGMSSNGFSIADPSDAGMLDVVGLDVAVPQLVSQFSRGL